MQQTNSSLYERLLQAKILLGEEQVSKSSSLWYITALQAFSGWVAALFFVAFVGVSFGRLIYQSPVALFILGLPPIIFAYYMLRSKQSELWEHFALAISMTGQVMVIVAFNEMMDYESIKGISLFITLFQIFLVWIMPNYIHRLLSTLFASFSLAYLFHSIHVPSLYLVILNGAVVWLWLHQFTSSGDIRQREAISYGALISFLVLKTTTLYGDATADIGFSISDYSIPNSVAETSSGLILLYLVWRLLKVEYEVTDQKVIILSIVGVIIFSLLSMEAIGLTTGVTIIILGFSTSHRLLFGLGVVSLLFFISNYYYFTGVTLLDKSYILAIVGAALLLARWLAMHLLGATPKEVSDA